MARLEGNAFLCPVIHSCFKLMFFKVTLKLLLEVKLAGEGLMLHISTDPEPLQNYLSLLIG